MLYEPQVQNSRAIHHAARIRNYRFTAHSQLTSRLTFFLFLKKKRRKEAAVFLTLGTRRKATHSLPSVSGRTGTTTASPHSASRTHATKITRKTDYRTHLQPLLSASTGTTAASRTNPPCHRPPNHMKNRLQHTPVTVGFGSNRNHSPPSVSRPAGT